MGNRYRMWLAALVSMVMATSLHAATANPVTSGLVLSLDGNHVTTSGTTVTSWNDQSGLGHDAVDVSATYVGAAYAPTLSGNTTPGGVPTLAFSTAGKTCLDVAGSADFNMTGVTWYVVFKANSGNNSTRLLGAAYNDTDPTTTVRKSYDEWGTWVLDTSTSNNYIRTNVRKGDGTATTTANTAVNSLTTSNYFIAGGTWDTVAGGYTVTLINDLSSTPVSTLSRTGATAILDQNQFIRIGATGSASGANYAPLSWFDGEIAGLLVYDRVLSASEQADVQDYLYNTYMVPEPATLTLLVAAGAGFLARRRNRR